jgi:K+-sensing histidine kinase KdpD
MTISQNTDSLPTIIVCIDASNISESSLNYACYKANKSGFAVKILSVVEQSHQNLIFGSKAIGNQKRKFVENSLAKLLKNAHSKTGIIPEISVREGDIVKEIKKELEMTYKCPMIVLGKTANALSDNLVIPKIIQKLGNKFSIPVMVVPANLSDDFLENLI